MVTAAATWTGAATLELTITCPGGVSVSRSGPSGLSVEVNDRDGTGTCSVTLSLPPGTRASVTFTLTVEPGP